MSLQVWLPLNGNLNNQGLSSAKFSHSNPSYTTGKVTAKALSINSTASSTTTVTELSGLGAFSVSLWYNPISSKTYTQFSRIVAFGVKDKSGNTGVFRLETSNTNGTKLNWHGNGFTTNDGGSVQYSPTANTWQHLVLVFDGNLFKGYMNGLLVYTYTILSQYKGNSTLTGNITIGSAGMYGCINDLRIYDHCLSLKEINKLSKGLICHYPLTDISCTSSANKYSGETFNGKCASSSFTCTKLTNERGYNYKMSYTGTGSDTWYSIKFPKFNFTAGKTYDWSCKVRVNSCTGNVSLAMRTSRIDNDWTAPSMQTVVSSSKVNSNWYEYHGRATLTATSVRSGTEYTTSPLMEYYTGSMKTKDTVFSMNFDIKDIQVSECDINATTNDGLWSDGTVYDTSGYNNNGAITNSTAPSFTSNSPRYSNCYSFNGSNQYIDIGHGSKVKDEISVSWWGYMDSWSDYGRALSCTEGGGWNFEPYDSALSFLIGCGASSNTYQRAASKTKLADLTSGWHHWVGTYDGFRVCIYKDGVLDNSSTPYTTKTPIYYASPQVFIGCEANGTSPGTPYFKGKISDVRIYATALTADDVKELYNTPFTVTSNGKLLIQGEVIES